MDTPERFEQLIAFLGSQLPSPVDQQPEEDGTIVFTGGEPAEVVVHLTRTMVIVSEFACEWETPVSLVVKPRRVGTIRWRRLPETALLNAISALVRGAREARISKYRTCRACSENIPPELLLDDDVCHRCADQQLDTVH